MEELPDVIADNKAAMASQLGTGDEAEIKRKLFSDEPLDRIAKSADLTELAKIRNAYIDIAAAIGKKTDFEKYIANTIKETSKRIKQLMKEEQQAERAERTLQEKERLKERFPFIVPHEKRDGTTTYSVQPQLLAEYVRKHDSYFFLDTGGDKPPVFRYDNGCYYRVSDNTFKGFIRKHIEAFDELLANSAILDEVFRQLLMDSRRVKPSELNSAENLICFRNGLLNVDTLELLPHSADILCTVQIPCDWNENAPPCIVFDSYIHKLTDGDRDIERLLWEYAGFTISNMNGYGPKKALFLYGQGNTGKSVYLDALVNIVGVNNYVSTDLKNLDERFGTMPIFGKRLAGCPDMGFMRIKELSMFKKITGGDKIQFEQKCKDPFTDTFRGVFLFCTNRLPKFGGDKGSHVYERFMLVPCNNVIPPEKRDRKLREKIYAECEGVVYKAVMALRVFRARGGDFIVPAACKLAMEEYKIENDAIRRFCEENTREWEKGEPIYKDPCTTAVVYRAYKNWATVNGEYVYSQSEFRTAIAEFYGKGEQSIVMKQRGNIYYPFTLKNSARIEYTGYKCNLSDYEQEQNSP